MKVNKRNLKSTLAFFSGYLVVLSGSECKKQDSPVAPAVNNKKNISSEENSSNNSTRNSSSNSENSLGNVNPSNSNNQNPQVNPNGNNPSINNPSDNGGNNNLNNRPTNNQRKNPQQPRSENNNNTPNNKDTKDSQEIKGKDTEESNIIKLTQQLAVEIAKAKKSENLDDKAKNTYNLSCNLIISEGLIKILDQIGKLKPEVKKQLTSNNKDELDCIYSEKHDCIQKLKNILGYFNLVNCINNKSSKVGDSMDFNTMIDMHCYLQDTHKEFRGYWYKIATDLKLNEKYHDFKLNFEQNRENKVEKLTEEEKKKKDSENHEKEKKDDKNPVNSGKDFEKIQGETEEESKIVNLTQRLLVAFGKIEKVHPKLGNVFEYTVSKEFASIVNEILNDKDTIDFINEKRNGNENYKSLVEVVKVIGLRGNSYDPLNELKNMKEGDILKNCAHFSDLRNAYWPQYINKYKLNSKFNNFNYKEV